MLRNKWEAFKTRSFLYKVVAVWIILITAYNVFAWVVLGSLFALLGVVLGLFILIGMWLDVDKTKKEYTRYHG